MREPELELYKGTLDVLILKSLSFRPAYGYDVSRWIRRVTGDALRIEEGALYPALHRLEERGWVEAEWGLSENNRRARFYRLTRKGARRLVSETEVWTRFAGAMEKALGATEAPSAGGKP